MSIKIGRIEFGPRIEIKRETVSTPQKIVSAQEAMAIMLRGFGIERSSKPEPLVPALDEAVLHARGAERLRARFKKER